MKKCLSLAAVFSLALSGCASLHGTRNPSCSGIGCESAHTPPTSDVTIHLLSTTDLHGYLLAQKNKAGMMVGGVETISGYFNIAMDKDPNTLLLDSGDLFQGTMISNDEEGAPVVKFYNYLGYDASAIGNHEYDYGPVGPDTVPRTPGEDPFGALKANMKAASFPLLSANTCSVDEDPKKCTDPNQFQVASFTSPYLIEEVNGLNVGLIGLTTTDTSETTLPTNVASLRFMPAAATLNRYVPEMKAMGADVIIVLAHVGGFCDKGVCNPKDELFSMIDSLTPDVRKQIALILAGHTHNYMNTVYNGLQIMVTGCYGQSFGYETLTYHADDSSVTVDGHQSVDFCQQVFPNTKYCSKGTGTPIAPTFLGETVTPDSDATAVIASDVAAMQAQSGKVVGKLISPLLKAANPAHPESSMGDFMTDAMRLCYIDSTCQQHADLALTNNGGIRSDIATAGPVQYGQVFNVMPFDNFVAVAQLSGVQIHALLDGMFQHEGGPDQVSGVTIEYNSKSTATRTFTNDAGTSQAFPDPIVKITMGDGSLLDESKTYTVILSDFLATGGSGAGFVMTGLKTPAAINYNRKIRDELVDYLQANSAGLDYSKPTARLIDDANASAN